MLDEPLEKLRDRLNTWQRHSFEREPMRDPYRLLGVSEDASDEEIRRSYRKLVRRHHPDLNPEDPQAEERFKEFQLAYETLTDPAKRKSLDRTSRQRQSAPGPEAGRRTEFTGDLSDLLKGLGYRTRSRAGGRGVRVGHLREVREEDVARVLGRLGIEMLSREVRVSFGDAADFSRRSPEEEKDHPGKRPSNEDLKRPPKPPKPPKW